MMILRYTGKLPLTEVEAFSPASHTMREIFLDLAPRFFAAGAVYGRKVCGGTNGGEDWPKTCMYFDVESQLYKAVRAL
jgi:hypothetical protein